MGRSSENISGNERSESDLSMGRKIWEKKKKKVSIGKHEKAA